MKRLLAVACLWVVAAAACSADSSTATPTPLLTTPAEGTVTQTASPRTAVPSLPPTAEPAVTPSPSPPVESARVVYRGDASRQAMALTFDAGADAGNTEAILRTLRERGLRATFSLTGVWAEENRDLLFAIAADGHQIINHTYDHASFTGASTGEAPLTAEERALELSRTERTIYRYTSRSTKPYFRPPYGDLDDGVRRDVANEGYGIIVMWTIDTLGWNGAMADQIGARVRDGAEPGAIVVMHVGSASQDAAALPGIIDSLEAAGYELLTIEELLHP